ncbi:MAG: regulatory protein RecX [Candidatus Saccharibacteria bacterium]
MKITDIKQQVKRPERYSIFVDGKFSFGLSENGLLESKIFVGMEIDKHDLKALQSTANTDKAYGNSLRYVVMRPRSLWEMQTYLRRKQVEEPVAEVIIQKLQALDLLNDLKFAEAWVANRRLLKATSKRKLRQELQQKRVSESVITQVLQEDETDERTVLRALIAKKRAHYPEDAKLMQYLARQGFSYDDIKSALGSYEQE